MPASAANPVVIRKTTACWLVRVFENGKITTHSFSHEIGATNFAAGERLRFRQMALRKHKILEEKPSALYSVEPIRWTSRL